MDIVGISVDFISCKNTYTTITTNRIASNRVRITEFIDAYRNLFVSVSTTNSVVEAVQAKFDEGYRSPVLAADDAMKGVSSANTMTVPVSSSGISPVFVIFTKSTSSPSDTAITLHSSHLRRTTNITPRTYLRLMRSNTALKALRNLAAKLSFVLPCSSVYGLRSNAHNAGESVKALIADIPIATAFSINLLTLFALVLAIGTVVDDAIVVVEAVQAKFYEG